MDLRKKENPKVKLTDKQKIWLSGWGDDMLRRAGVLSSLIMKTFGITDWVLSH